jgi:hypothetical protein
VKNVLTQSENTTILPLLIALTLGCFGLSSQAQAVCQEGCDIVDDNTFLGDNALLNNISGVGIDNTAIGFGALFSNTAGYDNTAIGWDALLNNTEGISNTACGASALSLNTTGHSNTATGESALSSNSTGNGNTATGESALLNTTGSSNTATGASALRSNTTGSNNIAVGFNAGTALTAGSNNIDIGNPGRAGEANTIRIGRGGSQTATFIAGIRGVTTGNANAIPVLIDSAGQLGTASSSRRFKKEIKPMDQTSEAILGLKPVTFRYKSDSEGTPQFGLIAEEVAEVNADLVVRDENGEIYTVRYEAVNAMLLNEFLKARRQIDAQQKQIDTLTAGLQKVSAKLEMSKSALQTVLNDQ